MPLSKPIAAFSKRMDGFLLQWGDPLPAGCARRDPPFKGVFHWLPWFVLGQGRAEQEMVVRVVARWRGCLCGVEICPSCGKGGQCFSVLYKCDFKNLANALNFKHSVR